MLLCSGVYIHGRKGGIKNNCQVRDFAPATSPYNLILRTLWRLVPVGSSEHPQLWKAEPCGLVCRALRDAMTRAGNLHSSVGAAMGLKSSHEQGDPAAQGTHRSLDLPSVAPGPFRWPYSASICLGGWSAP